MDVLNKASALVNDGLVLFSADELYSAAFLMKLAHD